MLYICRCFPFSSHPRAALFTLFIPNWKRNPLSPQTLRVSYPNETQSFELSLISWFILVMSINVIDLLKLIQVSREYFETILILTDLNTVYDVWTYTSETNHIKETILPSFSCVVMAHSTPTNSTISGEDENLMDYWCVIDFRKQWSGTQPEESLGVKCGYLSFSIYCHTFSTHEVEHLWTKCLYLLGMERQDDLTFCTESGGTFPH